MLREALERKVHEEVKKTFSGQHNRNIMANAKIRFSQRL
jgi:hypothetical protein